MDEAIAILGMHIYNHPSDLRALASAICMAILRCVRYDMSYTKPDMGLDSTLRLTLYSICTY